jgi:protein TonB
VFRPPVVVERVEPVYSRKARKKDERGTIVINVLVGEDGRIARVVVDRGIPGSELEAAAMNAVVRWKFEPATEGGKPVKAWTKAEFVFD